MKPYLFKHISEHVERYYLPNRLLLNDAIEKVNSWTRAGCQEEKIELLLAEIDLTRRIFNDNNQCGDWFYNELDKLTSYIVDGTIPQEGS